jgi:hypothetical protein
MSLRQLGIRLLLVHICWQLIAGLATLNGQPACFITGGSDTICFGTSTIWSAPDGLASYYWSGPSGFTAFSREITVSLAGEYTVTISDLNGTNSCSRDLTITPELLPGSINTALRQFCVGGTAAIGGASSPYGPATGGSGSYYYTWQMQEGCTGGWTDISGTNTLSYTPVAPPVTTCYRRKVTDLVCNTESFTAIKIFEIFEDPVSQNIVPSPENTTVCSGTFISATFTGGSGGFPGGFTDIYEYSTNNGTSWAAYSPGQNISTAGLSGSNVVRIRTRRISTGVNGCNYGSYVIVSWSVNPIPVTSAIYHR